MPEPLALRPGVTDGAEVVAAAEVVRVLVLGPLAVEHDGRRLHVAGTHRRRLLAFLASRVGQVVGVDAIVDALWGDEPPATATRTIQSHVARLRGSFACVEGELIESTAGGYRLAIDPDAVDATEFERLAAQGRRRLGAGDFAGAASVLDRALVLWRGQAYVDFARTAEFASSEQVRLSVVRGAAEEDFAEARLECGALDPVIADLERLVAEQPGRERAWGLLMRALYATGRQHDALVAFERARRALVDGFGLTPGPELRAMEHRILEQDVSLMVRRESAVPAGLRRDSTLLVGREREWASMLDGWRSARAGSGQLRLLLGPADSGRTRLAAELAATAAIDGGHVLHVRGKEGFERPPNVTTDAATPGGIVDRVTERSRTQPVLVVVDDAEWCDATTVETILTLAGSIEHAAVMVLVIAEPSASGPAIQRLLRLDPSEGRTLHLDAMPDDALAQLIAGDGVDGEGVAAVLAVAGGLPGVARREAAAWAERAASDRLTAAAASSIDATAVAVGARASMFDDVLALVAARTRRDELISSTWEGRQPYRALAAYEPQDADLFVGRERLVAELAARVLDRRLVAVIGASGSGKSSLVRAGLVPLARSGLLPGTGPWRTNVVVPSADPGPILDAVDSLDEPGPQLLVLDQFEEVFTTGSAEAWAGRILDLVLDTALDVHAVIVMRADQYGALATIPPLAALIEAAQVVVGAPTDDELRRIIVVPARRTGCHVEPDLIDLVADDVAGHDAALPLVSAALAELWRHRVDDTLTADGYIRLGGLSAAVERMGAGAVQRADEDGVRDVMLRLVEVTEDGQWVRWRVALDEVPDALAYAVDALVDARLVQRDHRQLDVVHEVVFHAWPQLASWLEEARGELVLAKELRSAARAWDVDGRNDDDLYRGARLAAAVEWCQRHPESATPQIAEFVAAGSTVADHDRLVAKAQLVRERRTGRRLRRSLVAASLLLVLSLVAAGLALAARRRADHERDRADAARIDAESQRDDARVGRLVADSQRAATRRLDLALLLAVEARRHRDSIDTRGTLLTALGGAMPAAPPSGPVGQVLPTSLGGFIATAVERAVDVDLSADGRVVAVGGGSGSQGAAAIHDVRSRAELLRIELDYVPRVDLAEDGGRALVWGARRADIYDVSGRAPVNIAASRPVGRTIDDASLSPDASTVAVLWGDGSTTFHDTTTGERLDVPSPPSHAGLGSFLPDGTLALGVVGGSVRWDVAAGRVISTVLLEAHGFVGEGAYTLSPDLALLVGTPGELGDHDEEVVVWAFGTGRLLGDPSARPPARSRAVFVSERVIAVGGPDGAVSFYDLATEQTVRVAGTAHAGGIRDLWASGDGRTLVSVADDGLVGVWGTDDPALIERTIVADRRLGDVSADGSRLAVLTPDGRAEIATLDGSSSVTIDAPAGTGLDLPHCCVSLSADGNRVLVLTGDETVGRGFVADTRTGKPVWVNKTDDEYTENPFVEQGDISPDGSRVFLVLDYGTELRAVDVASGDMVARVDAADLGLGDGVFWTVKVSPDGRFVDAVHGSGVARFDASTLKLITSVDVVPLARSQISDLTHVPGSDDLLAVGRLGRLYRIDMSTGEVIHGQSREATNLQVVGISADGSVVAATHPATSAVALFDADTLEPMGDPLPAGDGDFQPWFTADGNLLGNSALGVSEWVLDPDEWQAIACRIAGRNLTRSEWAEYLGDEPYRATCPEWPPAAD